MKRSEGFLEKAELEWTLKDRWGVMCQAGGKEGTKHYGIKATFGKGFAIVPIWLKKMIQVKCNRKVWMLQTG